MDVKRMQGSVQQLLLFFVWNYSNYIVLTDLQCYIEFTYSHMCPIKCSIVNLPAYQYAPPKRGEFNGSPLNISNTAWDRFVYLIAWDHVRFFHRSTVRREIITYARFEYLGDFLGQKTLPIWRGHQIWERLVPLWIPPQRSDAESCANIFSKIRTT